LHQEAKALLDSGKFFETVENWLAKTNVKGLNNRIILDLLGSAGILTGNLKRALCVKYIGATGTGKSLAQNIKAHLMPVGSVVKINSFTVAVLKRKGDAWKNKMLVIDEMTSLMGDENMRSILKSLISEGELKMEVTEPSDGKHNIINLHVEGAITVSTCTVEHTQSLTLGASEDEMSDRFIDIPMPTTKEYIKYANSSPLNEEDDVDINTVETGTVELIRAMIEIAMSRPTPTIEPGLRQALQTEIRDDLFIVRSVKQLKALMQNCAALSGKAQADYETFNYVYPLASLSAQTKASPKNSKTYDAFKKLIAHLRKEKPSVHLINMNFEVSDIKVAFHLKSNDAAYKQRDNFKDSNWIQHAENERGKYCFTNQGIQADKEIPHFEDIIPSPIKIKAILGNSVSYSGLIPVAKRNNSEACNPCPASIVEDTLAPIPVIPVVLQNEVHKNMINDSSSYINQLNELKLISEVEQETENEEHAKVTAIPKKGQRVVISDKKSSKYQEQGEVIDAFGDETGIEVVVCMDKELEVYSFPLQELTIIDDEETIVQSEYRPQTTTTRTLRRLT
jgi:hypothetical protein